MVNEGIARWKTAHTLSQVLDRTQREGRYGDNPVHERRNRYNNIYPWKPRLSVQQFGDTLTENATNVQFNHLKVATQL